MLSKTEQLIEYAKCIKDPIYAIETYLETFDKTQNKYVPFKLFFKQKEIVQTYEANPYNVITKPRQAGVTTVTAAYCAVKMAFGNSESPEKILILANKQDISQELLSKIKDFLSQMPNWVYGTKKGETFYTTDSKKHIVLVNNGCEAKALATSKDALRGFTPTWVIMDEAAYIDNGDEVLGATMASLSTGGKIALLSTPNGHDPLYYKTYEGAKTKKNSFNIIELRWHEDPRYNKELKWVKDEEIIEEIEYTPQSFKKMIEAGYKPTSPWYEGMCLSMNNDKRMIAQELDVSFIGSGGNVVEEEHINYQEKHNVKPPIEVVGSNSEVWVWEKPKIGHKYILSADASRGDGMDYSTITVIDFTTMEQVMEYQGKIQPDLLGEVVYEYAVEYNAYVVVDITGGMGVATVLKLLDMGYKNIHYDEPRNKLLENRTDLKRREKQNKVPGLNVSSIRLNMIANMEELVRNNAIKIRSRRTTSEMKTFIYKNGRPDHIKGYNDDCLMALAMGLWVLQHCFKDLEKLESQTKAILNSWASGGNSARSSSPSIPYNRNTGGGEYMWLFGGLK